MRWHAQRDVRMETISDSAGSGSVEVIIEVGACDICGTDLTEYRHGPISAPVERPNAA